MKLYQFVLLIYLLSNVGAVQWCQREMYETSFRSIEQELHVLVIWFPVHSGIQTTIQLCSTDTGLPLERQCSHNPQGPNATWSVADQSTSLFDCSLVNECTEEKFEHYYVMKNKVTQSNINQWLPARLGEVGTSQEPCLLDSGLPLTRKCIFNSENLAAQWEDNDFHNVKCLRDINQDIVTYDLNKLYQEVRQDDDDNLGAAVNLTNLLAKVETVRIPADLEIATNILKIITHNNSEWQMAPKVLKVTNLLMSIDDNIVLSSAELGAPKALIKTVEEYLDRMTNMFASTNSCEVADAHASYVSHGVYHIAENFTSVFFINPACSNISGIAVYNASIRPSPLLHYDSPTNTYFRLLYLNQSQEEIMHEHHLEAAAYFPETLWTALLGDADGVHGKAVRISLYRNKNFFVDQSNSRLTPRGIILKVTIPDYTKNLPEDLPIIFKRHQTNETDMPQCANWNYNTWTSSGDATANNQNLVLCKTRQLMSFEGLVGVNYGRRLIANSPLLTIIVEFALDFISIVGCGLSLFGLTWIWLTALCCKEWRSQSSSKLLLNMCFVLTLIMGYFLFINLPELRQNIVNIQNPIHCIAEGAFLHYMILVLFVWMLFIAILQYQRYVIVIGIERPRHFIAKYALASWGLPLIPTALVIYLDAKSYLPYSKGDRGINPICYPSGVSLYCALLLPITCVIIANVGIIVYILSSIRRSFRLKHRKERKDIIKEVNLSILLFFLLGISWIFGILAHLDESRVLSLLFCLTSTLQGFILFIYFVVLDKSSRYSWFSFFCGKDYYTLEETTMTPMTQYCNNH